MTKSGQTIFLHIGMHKTGSTAIQSAFRGYKNEKVKYAQLGVENHSIPFYTVYSGNHQDYHIWRRAGLNSKQIEAKRSDILRMLSSYFQKETSHDLIVSGEDISMVPREGVESIKQLLTQNGARVIVIVYVRSPESFIASNLQELIKSGISFDTPPPPSFRNRIEKFIEIFGDSSIIIRDYDRKKLIGEDIITDFSSVVDCEPPEKPQRDNKSLSTEAIKSIYILNKLVSSVGESGTVSKAREEFVRRMTSLFPGRFEIPYQLVSGVIDHNDARWLQGVSGIDYTKKESEQAGKVDKQAIDTFLQDLPQSAIDRIKEDLMESFKVGNAPNDGILLIARYFLALLDANFSTLQSFNAETYLALNPDIAAAGVDPYRHFLTHGIKAGRRFR